MSRLPRLALILTASWLLACDPSDESRDPADRDASAANPRVAAVLELQGDPAAGEQHYLAECASCHLASGAGRAAGGAGKDLTDWLPRNSDDAAVDAILNGRPGMFAYGDVYSNQDVADIVAHLRRAFDGRRDGGS